MRVIGIDEAGYGPVLGPLVVGGVTLECERYDAEGLVEGVGRPSGIDDSKAVLSHRSMGRGEATVLTFLAAAGVAPRTRRELFDALLVEPPDLVGPWRPEEGTADPVPEAPCRSAGEAPEGCSPDDTPLPRWGAGPSSERVETLRARLEATGVRIAAARAVCLCPGRFNRAVAAEVSKGLVDYRLMARLLEVEASRRGDDPILAHCGKLGGRSHYEDLLQDLGLTTRIEESRARSAYHVGGLGQVEFLRSAESQHLAVAMASMVAKLVREHVLDQWHGMLAAHVDGDLGTCSGYRDPVTRRYIEATTGAREALGVPERCFTRLR